MCLHDGIAEKGELPSRDLKFPGIKENLNWTLLKDNPTSRKMPPSLGKERIQILRNPASRKKSYCWRGADWTLLQQSLTADSQSRRMGSRTRRREAQGEEPSPWED